MVSLVHAISPTHGEATALDKTRPLQPHPSLKPASCTAQMSRRFERRVRAASGITERGQLCRIFSCRIVFIGLRLVRKFSQFMGIYFSLAVANISVVR
ncbi:hypothetical protein RRG08_042440 [Elysia crispata]|uniref:Uncharacterized protein n=1 Tax=Elysia crispata TaxID=231223 RepID=A0AAE0ZE06_9GAST|nr:hypothetical protein RRG08_042440 [Elysia crispata]